MGQKETLVMQRGRVKLRRDLPKIVNVIRKENVDLLVVLSEFISMSKQTKSRQVDVSYFDDDVFGNRIEEIVIRDTKPAGIFRKRLNEIMKERTGIVKSYESYENGQIRLHVFIEEPNWELEELIYDAYGELLDKFPTHSFDLKVMDLCGREE